MSIPIITAAFASINAINTGFRTAASQTNPKQARPALPFPPPADDHLGYYRRAAELLEQLRDEIGHGFGENDIEEIGRVVIARLRDWDRLDKERIAKQAKYPQMEPFR